MVPCKVALTRDSCREFFELLPHSDHVAGSFPVKAFWSSLTSAKLCTVLQLLGKVPTKLLLEIFSTARLVGNVFGKLPERLLLDRSSRVRLVGRDSAAGREPERLLFARYSNCKLAGRLLKVASVSALEDMLRNTATLGKIGMLPVS